MAESKMAEFKMAAINKLSQNLSQIELVGDRVRMEWECFWVNLREDNKVLIWDPRYQGVWIQDGRIQEFKMADINKLSENEWVWVRLNHLVESEWSFLCKCWELILASVSEFEWQTKMAEFQDGRIEDGCHH